MSDALKVVAIVVVVLLLAAWRARSWVRKARVLTRVGLDLAVPDDGHGYHPPDDPPERP